MVKQINKFKQSGVGIAVAVALAFAVQPAFATNLTFQGLDYANPNYSVADTVHIKYTGINEPAFGEYVYSGGFVMQNASGASLSVGSTSIPANGSFLAWCIDIYANMDTGTTAYNLRGSNSVTNPSPGQTGYGNISGAGGDGTTTNLTTPNTLTSNEVLEIERLASNDLSKVTNLETSSAFQLALWEIMAGSNLSLDPTKGSTFAAYGDSSNAITIADGWLANLGNAAPTEQLYVWAGNKPGYTQDLAVFVAVPEPENYAMLLAGLGLMGFMARRKKTS